MSLLSDDRIIERRPIGTVSSISIRSSSVSMTNPWTSAIARIDGCDPGRPNGLAPGPKSISLRLVVTSPQVPVCQ